MFLHRRFDADQLVTNFCSSNGQWAHETQHLPRKQAQELCHQKQQQILHLEIMIVK